MALFDQKNFNGEVFGAYVDQTENLNRNELLKSGAIVEKPQYASLLPDQTGGNYLTIPIKARIGGTANNYDGNTNITAESRETYTQSRIVVGRANGWTEKDFSSDITGEDFLPAAQEIAEYWDDVDQKTILAILKGIFSMTGAGNVDFVTKHTYDVSDNATEYGFKETTLNNAIQKALGDNKAKFSLAIMHSKIATDLENLKLIAYMKYTDAQGIERDLTLGTLNGRTVLVDDNMPTETAKAKYVKAKQTDKDALEVVDTGATKGQVNKADVSTDVAGAKAGDYVVLLPAGDVYTTYVFGAGAIEYTDCGAKVPYEMDRNPEKNGGETTLYSRQRKCWSPVGISFKDGSIISPTDEELEKGSNWQLAQNNKSGAEKYFPIKAIPIARIKTRG
jgi:hypothetical protein|nr:MAG TPA: major capsid protein [Caudoviricetes sp.]